jgi:hypothetical protein
LPEAPRTVQRPLPLTEAARLCDAMGYRGRAAELREKSRDIRRRSGD